MTSPLTEFAAEQQRRFDASTSPERRKERGHFGTRPAIAKFMAELFSRFPDDHVRILDPGAGVGTLSAAICERALQQRSSCHLFFELWENDPQLVPLLKDTMTHCQCALREAGQRMEFAVRDEDFIVANTRRSLFENGPTASFQWAVLNPPYFKLRKDSSQAQAMKHVVHGQPNIYSLFMAVAADLLLSHGEMVAITPRSYFNGLYFRRFRKWFFDRMVARQIHVFESRTEAFKDDSVLQENVILHAEKGGRPRDVVLTTSVGRELTAIGRNNAVYDKVVDNSRGDHVVRITSTSFDREVVTAIDSLPCRFRNLGFAISTGPVVTFRSTEFLRRERGEDTAPLLWMHNVRPFITQFPPDNGKPTHIEVSGSSKRLLLPAKTYILLKRFTSKEEKRRLVAGIMTRTDSYSEWVGLENHLNYVYRRGSELSRPEAFGLAAFFNSALVDRYFRAISGNTQVNATEIREMPVPDERTLVRIGEEIERVEKRDSETVEQIVARALSVPQALFEELAEVSQ